MAQRLWLPIVLIVLILTFGFVQQHIAGPEIVSLVNSGLITDSNYDTYESPQGTPYQVPTGQTLTITRWIGEPHAASGTSITLEIGYGDDDVQDSATPPTNAVVVYALTWTAIEMPPINRSAAINIPSSKYPWVRLTGGDYNVQVFGVEK